MSETSMESQVFRKASSILIMSYMRRLCWSSRTCAHWPHNPDVAVLTDEQTTARTANMGEVM